MRNKVRKLQHETVGELTKAILVICGEQQYNFQEQLRQIVRSAVGVDDEKGVLSIRSEYYLANSPVNWVPEYLKLVELLQPTEDFMRRVVASADSPVFLEVLRSSPSHDKFPELSSIPSLNNLPQSHDYGRSCVEMQVEATT
jgi:hypothetical protein